MKYIEPDFIREFHCIAGRCTDTCCAGWEIVLDEEAAGRYRSVSGAFGDRLRREMCSSGEEVFFRLTPERRCPFLNRQNLCDLFTELGEDALCDICREHPRFYNWYGDYTEKGLGLCCEEAERLLFAHPESVRFVETEVLSEKGQEKEQEEDRMLPVLQKLRTYGFEILQNREIPLAQRLQRLKNVMKGAQAILDIHQPEEHTALQLDQWVELAGAAGEQLEAKIEAGGKNKAVFCAQKNEQEIRKLLSFYQSLEFLDERWPGYLAEGIENLPEILNRGLELLEKQTDRAYEWEHLAVYFLYRYFMEALYDYDIWARVQLLVASLEVLAVLAGARALCPEGYTREKRDLLVRMYSREIEYCPENMDALFDWFRDKENEDAV